MLYFEIASVLPLLQFHALPTTVALLPEELAARVMRPAHEEERVLRAAAYTLLEKTVRTHTNAFQSHLEGMVKPEYSTFFGKRRILEAVRYAENGKPYFAGYDHVAFSLSHSGHMVACALVLESPDISAAPVGVDIQKVPDSYEKAAKIAENYYTEGEKALLDPYSGDISAYCREFTRIWTRKEAMVKLSGVGLAGLRATDSTHPEDDGFTFREKEFSLPWKDEKNRPCTENYIATVCYAQNNVFDSDF